MKKFILFLTCLAVGLGILTLSLISDTISCLRGHCTITTKINYLNITLNHESFSAEQLATASCIQHSQPARKGKRIYYTLQLKINEQPFNISTFNKKSACKTEALTYKKLAHNSNTSFKRESVPGFINSMGIIFALITMIIGIIILKNPDEAGTDEREQEEE